VRDRAARVRAGGWWRTVGGMVWGLWSVTLLCAPVSAQEPEGGHYPLYRRAESRCLTVRSLDGVLPGDRVFGGPYPLERALEVLRARCPVPFSPSGDWLAVQRRDGCWLVPRNEGLEAGDLVIVGNVDRRLAVRRLEETCESYRLEGAPLRPVPAPSPPPHTAVAPTAPTSGARTAVWAKTSVPWIDVYSGDPAGVRVRETTPRVAPAADWKALTAYMSIEPASAEAVPQAVRIRMPSTVQVAPEQRKDVALAFYEEATSHDGSVHSALWHLHAMEHDAATGVYEAELHHASVVAIVLVGGGTIAYEAAPELRDAWTRFWMEKLEGEHFVLHYPSPIISGETARWTLEALEAARRFLDTGVAAGGAGVGYPAVPVKLDAYYISLTKKGSGDIVYAGFRQGKSGGKWLDFNLPSNIPGYDRRELRQTLAHELFHFVQPGWEGYSTFWNAWVGKAIGKEFPYAWLNEALSTAVELDAVGDPGLVPGNRAPIYNTELYDLGLRGLHKADQGYSAGLFVNYLVHRYGRELLLTTLEECKRQVDSGTEQDGYVALRRAVRRRSDASGRPDPAGSDPDLLWRQFAEEFLQNRSGHELFDPRLDRKRPYTSPGARVLQVSPEGASDRWSISVPPLSLKGQAARIFRVRPSKRDASGEALVDCEVRFEAAPSMTFDVVTPIHVATGVGKKAPLPVDAVLAGTLDRRSTVQSFQIHFAPGEARKLLSFNPIGLGAGTPRGTAPAQAGYELSCRLHEEIKPAPAPAAVATSAIDAYYRTLQRAAVEYRARRDAHAAARLSEICPDCDARYEAARAEADPIDTRIGGLENRKDAFSDEAGPILQLLGAYSVGAAGRLASPEDGPKILYLQDVVEHLGRMQSVCADMPTMPFLDLYPLGFKDRFVLYPSKVEFFLKHTRKIPSADTVEKVLRAFHGELGNMEPCEQELEQYGRYWKEHRDRALQYVQQLKASYPGL